MICNWLTTKLSLAIGLFFVCGISLSANGQSAEPPLEKLQSNVPAVAPAIKQDISAAAPTTADNDENLGKLNITGDADALSWSGKLYPGLRVTGVAASGIGSQAGLQAGDILLTLNGFTVRDDKDAEKILQALPDGKLEVSFARNIEGRWKLMSANVEHKKLVAKKPKSYFIIKARSESLESMSTRMLELMNRDRALSQLPPLAVNSLLNDLAQKFADDMVSRQYFGHVTPEGLGPQERAKNAKSLVPATETILSGAMTIDEAESSFMDESPAEVNNNRSHILSRRFKSVGIGVARKLDNTLVMVLEFSPIGATGAKAK